MRDKFRKLKDYLMQKTENAMSLEVYACEELLVTGCTSLMDFDENAVTADTVNGVVKINGCGLTVTAFRADLLFVRGKVTGIEFGGEI